VFYKQDTKTVRFVYNEDDPKDQTSVEIRPGKKMIADR
jgi:hypothetical protein